MATSFTKMERLLSADRGHVSGWFLFSGLILIALWLAWAFCARVTRYEVSDSARLEVAATSPVEAGVSGKVSASHLTLGRRVEAGDILLELDDRDQQLALKEERTRRAELEPQLTALRTQMTSVNAGGSADERVLIYSSGGADAQVRQARAEADLASQEAVRAEKLRLQGLISQAEAEKAKAEAESKRASADSLQQAELRLSPELKVRDSDRSVKLSEISTDITKLEGDIAAANANLERLHYEIDKRKVRASVSGRLTECAVIHPGAHISEGQNIGVILPDGKVQMVADFEPAAAFGKLRPGQPAVIRLNGFPWAQFGVLRASVSHVAGEIRNGKVRVELAVNREAAPLIPLQHGLPGTVEVEIEHVTPAAMLLRSAGQAIGAH